MTDQQIVELYFAREEEALARTQEKYGPWCRTIARNILGEERDVEECLSDCWLLVWNAIPPARPERFQGWLGAIVRNRALFLRTRRGRQGDTVALAELELTQCLADSETPEGRAEAAELGRAISAFLREQKRDIAVAFLRRYWYADSMEEIACRMGWSVSKTKSVLFRTRKKLSLYLKKEGLL